MIMERRIIETRRAQMKAPMKRTSSKSSVSIWGMQQLEQRYHNQEFEELRWIEKHHRPWLEAGYRLQEEDLIFIGVELEDNFYEAQFKLAWNSFFWLSLSRMEWKGSFGTLLWLGSSMAFFEYFRGNIPSLKEERNSGRNYVNKSPSPTDQISPSSPSFYLFLRLS